MQVEAEESKLLLLETFSLFFYLFSFFFTRVSSRGARARKNATILKITRVITIFLRLMKIQRKCWSTHLLFIAAFLQ